MKFALYVLGALCFAQLAFAQDSDGYTDIPVPAAGFSINTQSCVQKLVNKHKAYVPGMIDNLKTKCFTGVNVSPAAIDALNSKLVAFVNAADIFTPSMGSDVFAYFERVIVASSEMTKVLDGLLKTVSTHPGLTDCVRKEVAADPLSKMAGCMS